MIITFYDENFNEKMLSKIVDAFNNKTEEEIITIYLFSKGGSVAIMNTMLDLVNRNPNSFEIVGFEYIASSAFVFFIEAECKKQLIPFTLGMYHLGSSTIDLNDNQKPDTSTDEAMLYRMKHYYKKENQLQMQKYGFTKAEINKCNKGKYVFFQHERLLENQEKTDCFKPKKRK